MEARYLHMTLDSNRAPVGVCNTGHVPLGLILRYHGVLYVVQAVNGGTSTATPANRATRRAF